MAFVGKILKRTIKLPKTIERVKRKISPAKMQEKTLLKLLSKARYTAFGTYYGFGKLIDADKNPVFDFRTKIPVFDYSKIYAEWWIKTLEGHEDICWPGKINYFALSSGTSDSASKRIPITADLLKANKRTGVKQILSLSNYDIPDNFFEKGILMLGGSTDLVEKEHYFEGDLSGISQANLPPWFFPFYKPGKEIATEKDWNVKIDKVVENAPKWDIGAIVGVPAWLQITLERIIEKHKLESIHDIWPNLAVYTHGGVSFDPYKLRFEKLLAKPLIYLETYLASEGFFAYQNRPGAKGMKLVLNNGIFYEFVPFNNQNFTEDGQVKPDAKALWIDEVKENEEYALLISTCAGAWRYLIGDTIRFTSLEHCEIAITGRTKFFLSLCGEHLSVDNMNAAMRAISDRNNIAISEFSVAGISENNRFAHKWYVGADEPFDTEWFAGELDKELCQLNDDYQVERKHALHNIYVQYVPSSAFYAYMEKNGKIGSQNKFPRVLKGDRLRDWENFLNSL